MTALLLGFAPPLLRANPEPSAKTEPEPPAKTGPAGKSKSSPPARPRTEVELAALLREALSSSSPATHQAALKALKGYTFKAPKGPEREFALYAEGMLLDRLGDPSKGAASLHKLERLFPDSPLLAEAEVVMAQDAVAYKRLKEASARLHRALQAELPQESRRRAQELLMWVIVEQGAHGEGLAIIDGLSPLGTERPSERGLCAMVEILARAGRDKEASGARVSFRKLYAKSSLLPRVDLAVARMLGEKGEAKASARILQETIKASPESPEADEARLALASLLSEGRLTAKEARTYPTPEKLLSELRKLEGHADLEQRARFVRLRLHLQNGAWKEALDTLREIRQKPVPEDEQAALDRYHQSSIRAWTQALLQPGQEPGKATGKETGAQRLEPLLPYLDEAGVQALTPDQRDALVRRLTDSGLPDAALVLARIAPAAEQPRLRRSALERVQPESHPTETLELLPGKSESPPLLLKRAEAHLVKHEWARAGKALRAAQPGKARMAALSALLQRPLAKGETRAQRLREVESWMAQAREKGPDRAPLEALAGDLLVREGNWKAALARYPVNAEGDLKGWVLLQRATCLLRLGRKKEALELLERHPDEPGFKMERETLLKAMRG